MASELDSDRVYICDWLPPDFGAVGQYADLATREFAAGGERVVLIGLTTGTPSVKDEVVGGGSRRIVRLSASACDRSNTLRRLAWTARTNARLIAAAWPYLRATRLIQFTGSPPLFLHFIAPANLLLRKPLLYRIADFHPECLIAERGGRPGVAMRAALALTRFWRRRVDRFEAISHDQVPLLTSIGIDRRRIRVRRDTSPVAIDAATLPLPRPPEADDRALLLYSGTWGVAHDETTFLEAYVAHHREGTGSVLLWLNAVGRKAERVAHTLRAAQVPFVAGRPVPLAELPRLLVTADAHLITLSDAFVGLVLPSKVYGCALSGKPVLFVGSARSDVDLICREAEVDGYRRIDVGNVRGLTAALEAIGEANQPPKPVPARAIETPQEAYSTA